MCLNTGGSDYNGGVTEPAEPRSIMRTETIGILVIALVILAVILLRWGGAIHWSAR